MIPANVSISENEHGRNVAQEGRNSSPDGNCFENHEVAVLGSEISDSRSLASALDPLGSLLLSGNSNAEMDTPSSSRFRMSGSEQDLGRGDLLHLDVVSIPSNILSSSIAEISSSQARRNNRRLYWEALSRRSFSRISDSPTIVFATGPADDLGSEDRWLLNLSGDLHYDGVFHDSVYLGARSNFRSGRRWLLRSEVIYHSLLNLICKKFDMQKPILHTCLLVEKFMTCLRIYQGILYLNSKLSHQIELVLGH